MLLSALTMKSYVPQAGSLWVDGDPDDPTLCMSMIAEDNGIYAGEFHAWIGGPVDGRPSGPMPDDVEINDLSARHFKSWVERPVHCVNRPLKWRHDLSAKPLSGDPTHARQPTHQRH
jgi:hypothetical protein